MRVAVSSLGPSLEDKVDERFGRAAYLLIVDDDAPAPEVVDNTANRDALQGAGLGTAEIASEHGVGAVITGHLGPKAFAALRLAGIDGFMGTGKTVRDAVEELRAGTLARLTEGDAHAGMS